MQKVILIVGCSCIILVFLWLLILRCPLSTSAFDFTVSPEKLVPVPDNKARGFSPNIIPNYIIQTNEKAGMPEEMAKATNTLLKDNPEYGYLYFTDAAARKFIEIHFNDRVLKAYDDIVPGAFKADLFRYCVLYQIGGVYIDTGMVSLGPFAIEPDDEFISPEDNGTGRIYNAFIASRPGHPILKEAIDLIVDNVEHRRYTNGALNITGPGLLARAYERVMGVKVAKNTSAGNGVRIIEFSKSKVCNSGEILDDGEAFLATKYAGYRKDQGWYNTKPHYSGMWRTGKVYVDTAKQTFTF